jgi:3-methyladenine DNA glycosylase AlkD
MNAKQALAKLEALGDEKVRKHYIKTGASDKLFGVKLGDVRKLAKEIKANHELGLELWKTENVDARMLAILLFKPKSFTADQLDELVRSVHFSRVADWVNAYVVKKHPDKEALRERWMTSDDPMAARAGWNLTYERIEKDADGLDLPALLDRIEAEMTGAHPHAQWTMNFTLAAIGIHHAKLRKRALAIGKQIGLYSDYPTAKGCTSPFAPIWIEEMVKRQG